MGEEANVYINPKNLIRIRNDSRFTSSGAMEKGSNIQKGKGWMGGRGLVVR